MTINIFGFHITIERQIKTFRADIDTKATRQQADAIKSTNEFKELQAKVQAYRAQKGK